MEEKQQKRKSLGAVPGFPTVIHDPRANDTKEYCILEHKGIGFGQRKLSSRPHADGLINIVKIKTPTLSR